MAWHPRSALLAAQTCRLAAVAWRGVAWHRALCFAAYPACDSLRGWSVLPLRLLCFGKGTVCSSSQIVGEPGRCHHPQRGAVAHAHLARPRPRFARIVTGSCCLAVPVLFKLKFVRHKRATVALSVKRASQANLRNSASIQASPPAMAVRRLATTPTMAVPRLATILTSCIGAREPRTAVAQLIRVKPAMHTRPRARAHKRGMCLRANPSPCAPPSTLFWLLEADTCSPTLASCARTLPLQPLQHTGGRGRGRAGPG